jgi:hypothetical protein
VIWFMARDRRTRFGLVVGIAIVLFGGMVFYGWSPLPILLICLIVVLFAIRRRLT